MFLTPLMTLIENYKNSQIYPKNIQQEKIFLKWNPLIMMLQAQC